MLFKLRQRAKDEQGFTLIELLVVILIIGILAAIAIPSFLNQKNKAVDASAKELAHSAQVAAESYATDHAGDYTSLTATILSQYESTITTAAGGGNAYVSGVLGPTGTGTPSSAGYTVQVTPASGAEVFTLSRNNGVISRNCTVSGTSGASATGGGCVGGTW